MAIKADEKTILAKLEFAAKAAEEFLKVYNGLKAEFEEIKPLTAYEIKKKKRSDFGESFMVSYKIKQESLQAAYEKKLEGIMKSGNISRDQAHAFLGNQRSQQAQKKAEKRNVNSAKRPPDKS